MAGKKPVRIALLGAGARGELNLGTLAKRYPGKIKFVAVAEPMDSRRERFAQKFGLSPGNAFKDWRELPARPKLADAIINTLPCRMHYDSAMMALNAGYDLLLEKPMALTAGQCLALTETARSQGVLLAVSLQCRLNKIYSRMRKLMDEKTIGELMSIDCAENIGYWHFIMSYVRGIHHHSSLSHSFIMAKGIHDLDLVQWFAGAPAKRVASFGSLKFFTRENAPAGATDRCADGCAVESSCEFSALKQYLKPGRPDLPLRLIRGQSWDAYLDVIRDRRFRTLGSVVSPEDISEKGIKKALAETNYGRCVFLCPNNVVDHQTASIEFENSATASFSLNAFSLVWERTLNLRGTKGEIRSADFSGKVETRTFRPARVMPERIRYHGIIHGGGDIFILFRFADAVSRGDRPVALVPTADQVLESHLLGFAIDKSRVENRVIEMDEFRQEAMEEARKLMG